MIYKTRKKGIYVSNPYGKKPSLWKKHKTVSRMGLGKILNRVSNVNKIEAVKTRKGKYTVYFPYKRRK